MLVSSFRFDFALLVHGLKTSMLRSGMYEKVYTHTFGKRLEVYAQRSIVDEWPNRRTDDILENDATLRSGKVV